MMIHDFDMARFFLDEEPVAVGAMFGASSTPRWAKRAISTPPSSSWKPSPARW